MTRDVRENLLTLGLVLAVVAAAYALLGITGCGAPTGPRSVEHAEDVNGPAHAATSYTPSVEFMGGDVAQAIVSAANAQGNTLWRCSSCVPGGTSADLAEQLPTVIASAPDAVVVVVGESELNESPTNLDAANGAALMANISALDPQLVAAKFAVLQANLPQLTGVPENDFIQGLEFTYTSGPTQFPWIAGTTLLDYYDATATDVGLGLPTPTQVAAMVTATQKALTALKLAPGAR